MSEGPIRSCGSPLWGGARRATGPSEGGIPRTGVNPWTGRIDGLIIERMPHREVPEEHRAFARNLRNNTTDPERLLWWALRRRGLGGYRFRRQVPMGRYVLDFYCLEARLAVEVDGPTHDDPGKDERRDARLASKGIHVLRFWSNEVMGDLDMVLGTIANLLGEPRNLGLPRDVGADEA